KSSWCYFPGAVMSGHNPFGKADFLNRPRPLVKPVLVGGSLASGCVIAPLTFAAIAVVVTAIGAASHSALWLLYGLPIAAALAAPGVAWALLLLARQRWIEVTRDGFTLIRRDGKRQYRDEHVVSLAQSTSM